MGTEVEQRESFLKALPEHLAILGAVVRESVQTGDLERFATYLAEQGISMPTEQLEHFRDLVIVRRLDLKDLEPAARERLRARTLKTQSSLLQSADYRAAVERGETPRCRDCAHFVTAPHDDTPGGEKSCVELGTKGVDAACFGYTISKS